MEKVEAVDYRSRRWMITINNPVEKGYTHEVIKERLNKFKNLIYWCMSDEIGLEKKTYHTHIYIVCSGQVRMSTLKKRFDGGHFDMTKGNSEECRNYVFKLGKWKNTEKNDTSVDGTQEEHGELPTERPGKRNDLDDLYDLIKAGLSDYEIMEQLPSQMLHIDKIRACREVFNMEKYGNMKRDVEVTYIYGDAGLGKTSYVYDNYGFSNVYSLSGYRNPFDEYKSEDVMLMDEFRSQIDFSLMLRYTDGYPIMLPARYGNKQACYTKVFIVSNIRLLKQYKEIQKEEPESFEAFLRRINKVMIFTKKKIYELTIDQYMNDFVPLTDSEGKRIPFKEL